MTWVSRFDFQSNEVQGHFDTSVIPYVTNLYLGYVPNETDPRNPSVLLICPCEGGALWTHELEPPAAFIAGEIGPAPDTAANEEEELVRLPATEKTKNE